MRPSLLFLPPPPQHFIFDFHVLRDLDGEGREEGMAEVQYTDSSDSPPPTLCHFLRLEPGKKILENLELVCE